MSVHGITGAAGTGKTTRLLETLREHLLDVPLVEGQRVLALTAMHGSRMRLHERLAASLRPGEFECVTFDRFAWEIARRWRTRLRERGGFDDVLDAWNDALYERTCAAAARLLEEPYLARWIYRRYPVVIVDEFQDCKSAKVALVDGIAARSTVIVAADEFQDLDGGAKNEACEWLRSMCNVEVLSTNHRTSIPGLVAAAGALRSGSSITEGRGFKLLTVPAAAVGAAWAAYALAAAAGRTVAIITPTRPARSTFVAEIITKLRAPITSRKTGRSVGPFSIRWEMGVDDERSRVLTALGLSDRALEDEVGLTDLPRMDGGAGRAVDAWISHQQRVLGRAKASVARLQTEIQHIVQRQRAMRVSARRLSAMTVHQAKNREFSEVIVLWPYEIHGAADLQRRRLYNAITRARMRALVLVQCRTGARLGLPPFSGS